VTRHLDTRAGTKGQEVILTVRVCIYIGSTRPISTSLIKWWNPGRSIEAPA
jgi:hypothetical protein